MADYSPDHEYETIKVYFNGKEYNMKDKKDRKKLKEIQYEEKYKIKMAKMMEKYGLRDINEWVCDHPNTLVRLSYEVYLEEEQRIATMKTVGWAFLLLSITCGVASFFIPGLMACMIITLIVGCDILTNNRIDNLEQRRWREMVYSMYRSGKEEEKNDKKHRKV